MVASQHPLCIGGTQSPAQQYLLLGFFAFLLLFALVKASFQRLLAIKKPALFVRAL
jgi:hypothetical protein